MVIPYDANIASFRNIEDIDDGSKARILELIVTLIFGLVVVVRV